MAKKSFRDLIKAKEARGEELLPHEVEVLKNIKVVAPVKGSWRPKDKFHHTPQFVAWIDSMLYGKFSNKTFYAPFDLYKKQADAWMAEAVNYSQLTSDERFDYHYKEFDRISENTYYFADKYAWRRDETSNSGEARYESEEHHKVVFFLCDCGYSFMLGKGRQIGLTTAMGIVNLKSMVTQLNYFAKYICQDQTTGEEIFEQKLKWPFAKLPRWMRADVSAHAMDNFRIGKKNKKGGYDEPNSHTTTMPPTTTAINGGSPSRVLIDEIGEIFVLSAMLAEGRPTLYTKNKDGIYVLARQVLAWGCVCAGTKVWTNSGKLINVEDLTQNMGILGYSGKGVSKGKINGMNPPANKPCYRIETSAGNFLECSYDHPILWNTRNYVKPLDGGGKIDKASFRRAEDIRVGDRLAMMEEVTNSRNTDTAYFEPHESTLEKGEYFNDKPNLSGFRFERVTKVTYLGERPIYNLNVSDTHTYLANGFITANTGGKMLKGKGAYKIEFYKQLSLWEEKEYFSGMIPLFFSWDCKFTQEEYEREKKAYYGGARAASLGVSVEETKIQFHQHYPTTFDDMFTSTASMLVDRKLYEEGVKRSRELSAESIQYGHFRPIYDTSHKYDENSYVPFKIIGAEFVRCQDHEIETAPITMRHDVEKSWRERYYGGIDPVQDQTGSSLFSSTILDGFINKPCCLLNWRKKFDPKAAYLQSMLMHIYYACGEQRSTPQLVEGNIGTGYIEFVQQYGDGLSLVFTGQLPNKFIGGAKAIGIDNHGLRADLIISEMAEFFRVFGENVDIAVYWNQMMTFEAKMTGSGKITWQTKDARFYHDDTLYSATYAYICKQCFPYAKIICVDEQRTVYKIVNKLTRNPDGTLTRKPTRVIQA